MAQNEDEKLFQPPGLAKRQCITLKSDGSQCKGSASKANVRESSKQMEHLSIVPGDDALRANIIRGLLCTTHRKNHEEAQLQFLFLKYKADILPHVCTIVPSPPIEYHKSARNSRTLFRQKLQARIKEMQYPRGHVYLFTWDEIPGFVKVGCSKVLTEERMKEWAKCHPGLTVVDEFEVPFPQRLEELVHLRFNDARYEVMCNWEGCSARKHDEWFKCCPRMIQDFVRQLVRVEKVFPLYDGRTRQLADIWRKALIDTNERYAANSAAGNLLEEMLQRAPTTQQAGNEVVDSMQRMTLTS